MNEYTKDHENTDTLEIKINEIKSRDEIILKYVYDFPDCFNELKNLRKLTILNSDLEKLPGSFRFLTDSTDLTLSFIQNINTEKILGEISHLTNLKRFSVNNFLATVIPKSFSQLKNLEEFNLIETPLNKDPESSLRIISEMTNLKKLELNDCGLTLPTEFKNLNNLTYLNLAYNKFDISCLSSVFSEMSNLKKLELRFTN